VPHPKGILIPSASPVGGIDLDVGVLVRCLDRGDIVIPNFGHGGGWTRRAAAFYVNSNLNQSCGWPSLTHE
jgi:hypothetical protein